MNEAGAPHRNTLHHFHFNPEVGSLPTPQRVNALNEAGLGRNLTQGSRGMRSFIIGKGLAFRDFQSRLQHFGPWLQPRRDCLTARKSRRRDASPCFPVPRKLARHPAQRGHKPWRLTLAGLHGLGPACYSSLLLVREFAASVGKG